MTLIALIALCVSTGLAAQIPVNENAAPVGLVHEIDFDLLPLGPTDVASINSIATPSASNIAEIVLTPNRLVPPGSYVVNPGLGRALGLGTGGLTLVDPPAGANPADRYEAFEAKLLLGGLSSEFGVGIGDYINTMSLEFFLAGVSLGTVTTSAYTTPGIKYFETPGNVFDEVHVRTTTGGGNFVISGLAIGETFGPPRPALITEGFVDGLPNPCADRGRFEDGATLGWQLRDRRDLIVGAPAVFFVNVGLGGEPPIGDSTPFLRSPFIQTTEFSNPAGLTLALPPVLVGASTGPASLQTLQIPPGLLQDGTVLRLQPLVLSGVNGDFLLRTSNPIRYEYRGPAIEVSAEGIDSFNSDVTGGFWKVRHNDPSRAPIARVIFDGTSNGMVFDTDQTGMADLFEGGNSLVPGCKGTYRNGSDVTTGLVYDALNTVTATPCDPAANTGWIGTNELSTDSFQTLEFRFGSFSAGSTFEFDVDTDGILGNSGEWMAFMTITVELTDGTILTGTLVEDSCIANRAEIRF
jgi:hypothetical protein